MSQLQFPITNEEAVARGYTLAEMLCARRALAHLWWIVREGRRHER